MSTATSSSHKRKTESSAPDKSASSIHSSKRVKHEGSSSSSSQHATAVSSSSGAAPIPPPPSLEEIAHTETDVRVLQFQNRHMYYHLLTKNRVIAQFEGELAALNRARHTDTRLIGEMFRFVDTFLDDLSFVAQRVSTTHNALFAPADIVLTESRIDRKKPPVLRLFGSRLVSGDDNSIKLEDDEADDSANGLGQSDNDSLADQTAQLSAILQNRLDTLHQIMEIIVDAVLHVNEVNIKLSQMLQDAHRHHTEQQQQGGDTAGTDDNNDSQKELFLLWEEKDEMRKKLNALEQTITQLQRSYRTSQQTLRKANTRIVTYESAAIEHEQQVITLRDELNKLQRRFDRQEREKQIIKNEVTRLTESKQNGVADNTANNNATSSSSQQLSSSPTTSTPVVAVTTVVEENHDECQQTITHLQHEIIDWKKRCDHRQMEINELYKSLNNLKNELKITNNKLTIIDENRIKDSKIYKNLINDLNQQKSDTQHYLNEIERLQRHIAEVNILYETDKKNYDINIKKLNDLFLEKENRTQSYIGKLKDDLHSITQQHDDVIARIKGHNQYSATELNNKLASINILENHIQDLTRALNKTRDEMEILRTNTTNNNDNTDSDAHSKEQRLLYVKHKQLQRQWQLRESELQDKIKQFEQQTQANASSKSSKKRSSHHINHTASAASSPNPSSTPSTNATNTTPTIMQNNNGSTPSPDTPIIHTTMNGTTESDIEMDNATTKSVEINTDSITDIAILQTEINTLKAQLEILNNINNSDNDNNNKLNLLVEQLQSAQESLIVMDELQSEYNEELNKNNRLSLQLIERENNIKKLYDERTKRLSLENVLRSESSQYKKKNETLHDQIKILNNRSLEQDKINKNLEELYNKEIIRRQNAEKQAESSRLIARQQTTERLALKINFDELNINLSQTINKHHQEIKILEDEKKLLMKVKEDKIVLQNRLDKLTAELEQLKNISKEKDSKITTLQRTVTANNTTSANNNNINNNNNSMNGINNAAAVEIDVLKRRLKCSVCSSNEKDTIITKCFHLFCGECIDDNIRSRNRKCPACGKHFDKSDVQRVFGLQ